MEQLLHTLTYSSHPFAIVLQFLIMVLVSLFPFAPIPLLAAIIGANHSFLTGLFINLGGTIVGSITLYFLSKNLLRNLAKKMLSKHDRYERFLLLIQTNGFVAVLIGRLVPFLPSACISLIAGISGVTFLEFTIATILGKFPIILAFSLAGNQLATGNWTLILLSGLYLFVIFLIGHKLKRKWQT
jgi:uncharacterized membrane protein YdjX (TVP38/TMEM64 family)